MSSFVVFIVGGWFICSFVASLISTEDKFTPQLRWVTSIIEKPFKLIASLVGAPGRLLRDYWSHKQAMKKLDSITEKRIASLEIALADKFLDSKHNS